MEETLEEAQAFANLMTGLAENYSSDITPAGMKIRFMALKEFPLQVIEEAVFRMIRSRRFNSTPNVGDIIAEITGDAGDRAEIEFTKVLDAIRRLGSYRSVKFEDPVTTATIEAMGGWTKICAEMTTDQERFFRREFARIYTSYNRERITSDQILLGAVDVTNSQFVIGAHTRGLAQGKKPIPVLVSPSRTVIPFPQDGAGEDSGRDGKPRDQVETAGNTVASLLKKIAK